MSRIPRRWLAAIRPARFALCALLLGLLPLAALAAEPQIFYRLYYSNWMAGQVNHSPADPQGDFTRSATLSNNPKFELEAIFLRRMGLSFSRQKMQREFADTSANVSGCTQGPCLIDERTVEQAINLTLYARPVSHDQFNFFLGGGAGNLNYTYAVDHVRQTDGELYRGMGLSRWFAGAELSLERIGFRIELSRVMARKTLGDNSASAELEENFRYFTVFIPLN